MTTIFQAFRAYSGSTPPLEEDRDEFCRLLAQRALGQGSPFLIPSKEEYDQLAKGAFRLGAIGRHGQGLLLDLSQVLPLGLSIVGGTGQGKTTLLTSIASGLSKYEKIGCWLLNVRPEPGQYLPGFVNVRMSEILPNLLHGLDHLAPGLRATKLADIIASTFFLLWSKTAITRELTALYRHVCDPSLVDVQRRIADLRSGRASGLTHQQVAKLKGVFDFLVHSLGEAGQRTGGFRPAQHWNDKLNMALLPYVWVRDTGVCG